ncbi:MAG: MlaE family lipid ABC transporter permease subunit [Deltaproteobacteria bacterium]|nr:MlaE family lipid ABC transporter permease subunit [Deltaproteobacteria bacterium]
MFEIKFKQKSFDELLIEIKGDISIENAVSVNKELSGILESQPLKNVEVDLGGLHYLDGAGIAVIRNFARNCAKRQNMVTLSNIPKSAKRFLDAPHIDIDNSKNILKGVEGADLVVQIVEGIDQLRRNAFDIITFIGGIVDAFWSGFRRSISIKWDGFTKLFERAGVDAVPIVVVLSFLMGAILAFQAAIQLRKFGANIFVADLVSVSICLEMGPLLTALIISGRSGAGYAAHVGSMQVSEEIDALRVLGIDPVLYLVSPRIIAVALAAPCLTVIADVVGIIGGCAVAGSSLDITPTAYFNQVQKVLEISDVMKGLIKSLVFGVEIASIGCFRGFQVRGGAESVGSATTSAVVTCIFVLTATNALFSVLFYYFPRIWTF